MQAVFYLCFLHQINLTMRQRDASQGKTGLLIAIVSQHPYTHAYVLFFLTQKSACTIFICIGKNILQCPWGSSVDLLSTFPIFITNFIFCTVRLCQVIMSSQCWPKPFGGPKQNLIWGPPPTTVESPVWHVCLTTIMLHYNCINTVTDYELLSPWAQMHKDTKNAGRHSSCWQVYWSWNQNHLVLN